MSKAKEVKEHVARAKAYAGRQEVIKALAACCEAIKGLVQGQIFGREKFEIEILFGEVLRVLSRTDDLKKYYGRDLAYLKGQEKKMYVLFAEIQKRIQAAKDKEQEEALRAHKNKIDKLVLKAQELLSANQFMEAKKVFRLVTEQYGNEPGLFTDVGTRMVKAGLHNEAVEYLQRAIELNAKDSRPYGYLTSAYEQLGRLDEAELLLRDALKQFGRNARVLARLAKLYKETRKWNEAYEMSRLAVDLDPSLTDARKILDEMERRLFGSRTSA